MSRDRVRIRVGGRSAEVKQRVFAAMREALELGDPASLNVERLAERAGVHRATIYRRWLSTTGLVADLLTELTPVETPLPDTGRLRDDLRAVVRRVIATVNASVPRAMLKLIAGSADDELAAAAAGYWSSILDRTAEVVRRAQRRGEVSREVDAVEAIESLLGPIYLRLLVTNHPLRDGDAKRLIDRTLRMLRP